METEANVHEHYLRHLLLLGQAVPVLLRATVIKAVDYCNKNLETILLEAEFTFKILFVQQYIKLFPQGGVNTDLMSWDTRLLCIVICFLFNLRLSETDRVAITCIMKQLNDLENYVDSASLDYKTYETKWNTLHKALLDSLNNSDSKTKYDCTRLIQSFAKGPIHVDMALIHRLKEIKDVNEQVNMAIKDFNNANDADEEIKSGIEDISTYKTESPKLINTNLQDITVYENEEIDLECELNTGEEAVKWFKYSERLVQMDSILITRDGCRHSLKITTADVKDTGIYTCLSGVTLTSAYVNVKEIPVEFNEHLTDKDVLEGGDITLSCKVNQLRGTPVWFHEGTKIETSNVRRNLVSNGTVHKLSILNAKLHDEGRYMIAFGDKLSEATLTVTVLDNANGLHVQQLSKENYRNWVRCALSLLYLKQGLVEFSNKCMIKQHAMFSRKVPASTDQCTHCSLVTLMPFSCHSSNRHCYKRNCLCSKKPKPRKVCPNSEYCSKTYDLIRDYHRNGDPCLANADIPFWNSDPWSVGVCFVNTPGYKNRKSAEEIDCSGLLSVFMNNKFFNTELGDVKIDGKSDLFKQARDARNDILHNPNYEFSISELNGFINLFKAVLEVRNAANEKPLETGPGQSEAMENLKRLQSHQIDIDEEVNKTTKAIIDQEIMESLEKAMEETEKKKKRLEETLKEKDEQIKYLRQVRNCQPPKKMAKFEVTFDMTIAITGSSKVKQHHDKIRERITTCINSPKGTQSSEESSPSKSSVDKAVETLMSSVVKLPYVDVSLADNRACLSLNIAVSSCNGMNALLTLINGKSFQQSVNQLRKCIEKDIGESVFVDAFITSDSCIAVRNQLSAQDILYDTHGDFRCNSHSWMQNAWYCVEHEEFCCTICKSNEHGSCKGMKNVISKRTEKNLLKVQKKKNYNVRVGGTFKGDKEICNISGICVLSTGEILLADNGNRRLKKLNSSFKSVSCCDLPFHPHDVCHIGKDVAAVTHRENSIQLVDVSGKMKLMHRINVCFRCDRLVCHGDILYITSGDKVYTCNTDGTCPHGLFSLHRSYDLVNSIAVSDDGEKIYIADTDGRILTVDKEGKIISANKFEGVRYVRTVGDGTLLIFSEVTKCVFQQDDEGERVLGSVVDDADALDCLKSLCFDRQHCRLIVAKSESDKISVFELK